MTELKPSRGWQGAVLKLMRAGDYRLTVTGRREISPRYLRLSFDDGGMLEHHCVHPTMWIRIWFAAGHQRGYTLVDPDPAAGTFDIEFALHEGCASDWARTAEPGDTVEATVLGSKFAIPEPAPGGYVIVGDTASLPAINSLLEAIGDAPAQVFIEACCDDDKCLPVGASSRHLGGPQERGAAGDGAVGGVRRRRPLRLGGLRHPHHALGRQGAAGGLRDSEEIH